ncbi:MAG TPA: 2'-5' RNA ligase family protein [Flavisolibacter sp.]|nr:2'-5' RNA ligase family protein [Flavisolibacter sp.]
MFLYFIAIVLPEALDARILPLKYEMKEKYGCMVGLKSPAHITLVPPFWMEAEREGSLIADTDHLSLRRPFKISTAGFSAFRPRTIFIDVAVSPELQAIKQRAEELFTPAKGYKLKPENRPFHPHITIATRDLHKKAFAEAWEYFEKKEFEITWEAMNVSVLRHNKKNWDVIHTSQFNTLSV